MVPRLVSAVAAFVVIGAAAGFAWDALRPRSQEGERAPSSPTPSTSPSPVTHTQRGALDDFASFTDGEDLGRRTALSGGTWLEEIHSWTVEDVGKGVGGARAKVGSTAIGFATLDPNLADDYRILSLIHLSDANRRAAAGIVGSYSDAGNNIVLKFEVTVQWHHGGRMILGARVNGLVTSALCHYGNPPNIGVANGDDIWLRLERHGNDVSGTAWRDDGTGGFRTATELGSCTWDLVTGTDEISGNEPKEYTQSQVDTYLDGERAGLRAKIISDEDDGDSEWRHFRATADER